MEDGDKNADQAEEEEDLTPPVPETRLLDINANNLPNVEDVTALKRMYLKVCIRATVTCTYRQN